jgi:hypothetical protein
MVATERFTAVETDGIWTVVDHEHHLRTVHNAFWPEEMARQIAEGLNAGRYHEVVFYWEPEP